MLGNILFSCLLLCGVSFSSSFGSVKRNGKDVSAVKRGTLGPWGYNEFCEDKLGPSKWGTLFPQCNGEEQSPIDIKDIEKTITHFPFHDYLSMAGEPLQGKLDNNGFAARFLVDQTQGTWTVFDGQTHFKLERFEFHFGCNNNRGSEHTINGVRYAGEMQMLFYNKQYGSLEAALGKEHGVLILASFLHEICVKPNARLAHLMNQLPNIMQEHSSASYLHPVYMRDMIPQYFMNDPGYFSYKGSITSPPCSENVDWIVLKDPLCLPPDSINKLRGLLSTHGGKYGKMCDNFRNTQPLKGRTVLAHNHCGRMCWVLKRNKISKLHKGHQHG